MTPGKKTWPNLELGGRVLPSGTFAHVDVELAAHQGDHAAPRYSGDRQRRKRGQALDDFAVQDGDKIKITPILPYADKTVYSMAMSPAPASLLIATA